MRSYGKYLIASNGVLSEVRNHDCYTILNVHFYFIFSVVFNLSLDILISEYYY